MPLPRWLDCVCHFPSLAAPVSSSVFHVHCLYDQDSEPCSGFSSSVLQVFAESDCFFGAERDVNRISWRLALVVVFHKDSVNRIHTHVKMVFCLFSLFSRDYTYKKSVAPKLLPWKPVDARSRARPYTLMTRILYRLKSNPQRFLILCTIYTYKARPLYSGNQAAISPYRYYI
jgi:hypothetical protein